MQGRLERRTEKIEKLVIKVQFLDFLIVLSISKVLIGLIGLHYHRKPTRGVV
jgi:hypothetical protein